MMCLYESRTCQGCKSTKMMLEKAGIMFEVIDVSTIPGFQGTIPQLVFDNGTKLIGDHEIRQWIRESGRY